MDTRAIFAEADITAIHGECRHIAFLYSFEEVAPQRSR